MQSNPDKSTSHSTSDALVRIRGLRFSQGERVILDGMDLDIPRGKVTAIMGPTGCGKTTLLRLIGGEWRPAAGTVHVDGENVHALSRSQLFTLRKRIGMMFQNGGLLTDMTVYENIAFPLREHTRLPEPMIRDVVLMKLEAVGLRGTHSFFPEQLSGGMARRVALARAIALDPMLVMYDEPFAGLDPISLAAVRRLIRKLSDALGLSTIVVTHNVRGALAISDWVYITIAGKIAAQGTPEQILASPLESVQQFLKGKPDGPVAFHYPAKPMQEDMLGSD